MRRYVAHGECRGIRRRRSPGAPRAGARAEGGRRRFPLGLVPPFRAFQRAGADSGFRITVPLASAPSGRPLSSGFILRAAGKERTRTMSPQKAPGGNSLSLLETRLGAEKLLGDAWRAISSFSAKVLLGRWRQARPAGQGHGFGRVLHRLGVSREGRRLQEASPPVHLRRAGHARTYPWLRISNPAGSARRCRCRAAQGAEATRRWKRPPGRQKPRRPLLFREVPKAEKTQFSAARPSRKALAGKPAGQTKYQARNVVPAYKEKPQRRLRRHCSA